MTEAVARRHGLQVIERAGMVLRALETTRTGMTLAELAAAVSLPKSTVNRLVLALADEGLVSWNGRGSIRLGPALPRLAAASRGLLRDEVRPYLERLATDVGETVDLSVLEASVVRLIDQIPSSHPLRAVSVVGTTTDVHCTAGGKALLAAMPRDAAAALLPARLRPATDKTITSRGSLWAELDQVAASGVAFDHEEFADGISAVGCVVRDAGGVRGAVSVVAPTARFVGREELLAERLRRACEIASTALGANGHQ
jgi:DNA-binding IclR family transcriptional regulator